MWTYLSDDGSRLSVSLSRPWLQGFIGLAFAGAGGFFLFLLARDGIAAPDAVRWGIGLFCTLFVLMGLTIAGHRRGITLDRESETATRWEGILRPMTSTRRSLGGFTTVQLESAVRVSVSSKSNQRHAYRVYQVKLTNPQGGTFLIGESANEATTRTAAKTVADFLRLPLDDQTTGDQPLPNTTSFTVGVDLPGVGPVHVSSAPPQIRRSYRFRECLEQPEGSRVRIEQYPEGVTLTVPPAGIGRGTKGLFPFSLIWCAGITVVGLIMVGSMQQSGKYNFVALFGLGFMGLVGLAMLAGAIQMGRRQAVLAVVNGRLMVLQAGPLGKQRHEWTAEQIQDIRAAPSRMESGGAPVIELQVRPVRGRKLHLLAGRDEEELRWLATVLRQALRVSPAPEEPSDETVD